MNFFKPLLPLAAAAVIGGGAGAVATTALNDDSAHRPHDHEHPHRLRHRRRRRSMSPHDVYQSAKDSVAYITTQVGTGSGFVVSDDGYLVTNAHVVEGANGQIKAKIGDGKTLDAKLVGQDASTDLALLKVSATNLKPLALGDSSTRRGRRPGVRDRQSRSASTARSPPASSPRSSARSPRPTASRSTTSCRPTPRSTPATPAARCSTRPGQVIGVNSQIESTGNEPPAARPATSASASRSRPTRSRASSPSCARPARSAHAYLGVQTQDASGAGAQVAALTSGGPAAGRRPAVRRRHHLARRQVRRRLDRALLARRRAQAGRPGPGQGHPQRRRRRR